MKKFTILILLSLILTGCRQQLGQINTHPIADKLVNVSATKKATIKGAEIAKLGKQIPIQRSKYKIEIVDMKSIEGGVEVYARAWDKNGQIGFGADGTIDIERFVIINPPVLVDDPDGDIVRTWVDEMTNETKTRKLRENVREAILQSLEHTIFVKQQKFGSERIQAGKVGNTTTTVYPQAGSGGDNITMDGEASATNANTTWATIIAQAGNVSNATEPEFGGYFLNKKSGDAGSWTAVQKGFFNFDTSTIGTDTISSAIISFCPTYISNDAGLDSNALDMHIVAGNTASNNTIANTDFSAAGTTSFGELQFADAGTGAYEDITLNASGITAINGSGVTKYATTAECTFSSTNPTNNGTSANSRIYVYHADQTGTTNDPKLVVEHSEAIVEITSVGELILSDE